MPAARWLLVLPFLFFFLGLGLSTWRFRLHDALGGITFGLAGVVALIVVAALLPASAVAPRPDRELEPRPRDTIPR